ncbi:MAG: hypothetical protein ACYC0F_01440 [Rhodanobacter sp.]
MFLVEVACRMAGRRHHGATRDAFVRLAAVAMGHLAEAALLKPATAWSVSAALFIANGHARRSVRR